MKRLDPEADAWSELEGAERVPQLLRAASGADGTALAELQELACHQFSLSELAVELLPDFAYLAAGGPESIRHQALVAAAVVLTSLRIYPPQSAALADKLCLVAHEAEPLILEAVLKRLLEARPPGEVADLLGALATLRGRPNLGMHLLLNGGSDHELSCPSCGEDIAWTGAGA